MFCLLWWLEAFTSDQLKLSLQHLLSIWTHSEGCMIESTNQRTTRHSHRQYSEHCNVSWLWLIEKHIIVSGQDNKMTWNANYFSTLKRDPYYNYFFCFHFCCYWYVSWLADNNVSCYCNMTIRSIAALSVLRVQGKKYIAYKSCFLYLCRIISSPPPSVYPSQSEIRVLVNWIQ